MILSTSFYYEEYGEYTNSSLDVFGTGGIPSGLVVDKPAGEPRFTYFLTNDGRAFAVPNTFIDASLGDVTNILVDQSGKLSGGSF